MLNATLRHRLPLQVTHRHFTKNPGGGKRPLSKSQLSPKTVKKSPDFAKPPANEPPAVTNLNAQAGSSNNSSNSGIILGLVGLTGAGGAYYYYNSSGVKEEAVISSPSVGSTTEKVDDPLPLEELKPKEQNILDAKVEEDSGKVLPANISRQLSSSQNPARNLENGTLAVAQMNAEDESGVQNVVTTFMNNQAAVVDEKKVVPEVAVVEMEVAPKEESEKEEQNKLPEPVVISAFEEAQSHTQHVLGLNLSNIDDMTPTQLRNKLLQLITLVSDSSQKEALRLKEYAKIVEKETSEKYLGALQKQKIELEALMSMQLREKEAEYNSLLEKQSEMIQSEYSKNFEEKWNAQIKEVTKSYEDQLQVSLGEGVAKVKTELVEEYEKKLETIQALSKKLEELQTKARTAALYEEGSQITHKTSAAALTLAQKMETSQPALAEFASLQTIVNEMESSPIAAALKTLPKEAMDKGVPTLPQLQSSFANIKQTVREAAFSPGPGLGAQLVGKIYATLSIAPPIGLVDGDSPDQVLARADFYVQQGDLEKALNQIKTLEGSQSAFVLKDWEVAAKARLQMDYVVRVIKMECAVMNKRMTQ